MKTLKIISHLDIEDGYLKSKNLSKNNQVFLRQGSIDGACGPYTLMMSMLILGLIDYREAGDMWLIKKSTKFGKFIKAMQIHETLFQSGTDLHQLKNLVDSSFGKQLHVNLSESKGKPVLNFIVSELEKNNPVIVGINGQEVAHWLLAVGFEENSKGVISKLFFLDSSLELGSQYWNASINILDTFQGRYPYKWLDTSPSTMVSF